MPCYGGNTFYYNNFLLELDRKQRETKDSGINTAATTPTNSISGKREINNS